MTGIWTKTGKEMTRRETIAHLLALKLEVYSTDAAGGCSKNSTIRVVQHKQKFGSIRVYCNLADIALINLAINTSNNKFSVEEEVEKYRTMSLLNDAKHYRETYLEFKDLFPDLWNELYGGADYPQLLCMTPQEFLLIGNQDFSWVCDNIKVDIRDICNWPFEETQDNEEQQR